MTDKNDKITISVLRLLWRNLKQILFRKPLDFATCQLPDLSPKLTRKSRSIFIRHLDCGSCNGCELELNALNNPIYDIEQYGIMFKSSPREADIAAETGPHTHNLAEAEQLTLEAMPKPRIIAIGDCAIDGGIFKDSYAVWARPKHFEEVVVARVPGCPPTPEDILKGLLQLEL